MSTNQSFDALIGYRYTIAELKPIMGHPTPEKFRMEKRFDPKSGKPLPDVKIVDLQAQESWTIKGIDNKYPESYHELFEEVNRYAKRKAGLGGEGRVGGLSIVEEEGYEDLEGHVVFGIDVATIGGYGLKQGVTVLSQSDLAKQFEAVMPLGKELEALGFPKREPALAIVLTVSY